MNTLSARSSPCGTPAACAAHNAEPTPRRIGRTSVSGNVLPLTASSSVIPASRSITTNGVPSPSVPTSSTCATCGWCKSATLIASRVKSWTTCAGNPAAQVNSLTTRPPSTGAPVRLENLPASPYARSDGNELGLPGILIWRRFFYVRGSVKGQRPA